MKIIWIFTHIKKQHSPLNLIYRPVNRKVLHHCDNPCIDF